VRARRPVALLAPRGGGEGRAEAAECGGGGDFFTELSPDVVVVVVVSSVGKVRGEVGRKAGGEVCQGDER